MWPMQTHETSTKHSADLHVKPAAADAAAEQRPCYNRPWQRRHNKAAFTPCGPVFCSIRASDITRLLPGNPGNEQAVTQLASRATDETVSSS